MQHTDIRRALDRALADPLTDPEWAALGKQDYVEAIAQGDRTHEEAIAWILGELRAPRSAREADVSETRRERQRLVSASLAVLAERTFGLASVRREILGDTYPLRLDAPGIDPTDPAPRSIHDWIQEQAARDRSADAPSRRLVYRGYRRVPKITGNTTLQDVAVNDEIHAHTYDVSVGAAGSALDRLRVVADQLASYCGWDPRDAVTFVLTGHPPPMPAIAYQITPRHWMPVASRIRLDIDPTCTPDEVARAYARIRKQEFGRLRPLTEKHLTLAVFAQSHPPTNWQQRPHERIGEWIVAWNKQHRRQGAYDSKRPSVFIRDCQNAISRLLNLGTWGHDDVSMPAARRRADAEYVAARAAMGKASEEERELGLRRFRAWLDDQRELSRRRRALDRRRAVGRGK